MFQLFFALLIRQKLQLDQTALRFLLNVASYIIWNVSMSVCISCISAKLFLNP